MEEKKLFREEAIPLIAYNERAKGRRSGVTPQPSR